MTSKRAIEAGAAHILRELHDRGLLEYVDDDLHEEIGVAVAQAAANGFTAEGFVVVPAAELQYIVQNSGERTIRGKARAMIAAAQQEQNDAGE